MGLASVPSSSGATAHLPLGAIANPSGLVPGAVMLTTCGCTPVASMVTSASALMLRAPVLDTTTWRPSGVTSILTTLSEAVAYGEMGFLPTLPATGQAAAEIPALVAELRALEWLLQTTSRANM